MSRGLHEPIPSDSREADLLRHLVDAFDDPAQTAKHFRHFAACDAANRGQERADLLLAAQELERGDRRATAARIRRLADRECARMRAIADVIENGGAP